MSLMKKDWVIRRRCLRIDNLKDIEMAKEGLTYDKMNTSLVISGKPWSLCIGAGCSWPIFPSWYDLAASLAKRFGATDNDCILLKKKFSPDVIIQSAFEKSKLSSKDFAVLLGNELYEKFFEGLSIKEKKELARCVSEQTPINSLDWGALIDRVTSCGYSTSNELAKIVTESFFNNAGPEAILSFNAELLLCSLINAHAHVDLGKHLKFMDYVTEPITSRYRDRLQYIFCHGVVQVPFSPIAAQRRFNVYDKLVFSENEYLQLANSSFAWQSNSFFNILTTNTVFFVGLSFTDPNIRRWLSWIHACKMESLEKMGKKVDSTSHYWIEKTPDNAALKKWYESSVAHLGIRIIWIEEWEELPRVLRKAVHLDALPGA